MTTIITNPGPGAYDTKPAINEKGSYFLSKFRNSPGITISPSKSSRFIDPSQNNKLTPGPGLYSPQGGFSKDGSYFVSKFKSSMCRTHYHFDRSTLALGEKKGTPGPGSYRLPSDFGYYEAKVKLQPSASQPVLGERKGSPDRL